jgi:hypothetical protein
VQILVAPPAKSNQIDLGIITERYTPSKVMNVEVLDTSTHLTAPVNGVVHATLLDPVVHVLGMNNRRIPGREPCEDLSVSKAAPAKKSAQIISSE